MHADQLDALLDLIVSSHHGVRVAVQDEGVGAAGTHQLQVAPVGVVDRAAIRSREGAVLVHADHLDGTAVVRGGQGVGVAVAECKGRQVVDVEQVLELAGVLLGIPLAGHGAVAVHAEELHTLRVVPADEGVRVAVAQAERGHGAAQVQGIVYPWGRPGSGRIRELRVHRGHCAVLVHADELDAAVLTTTMRVHSSRGHHGVRVAVAECEHFEVARLGERVVCAAAAAGAQAAVARLVGRHERGILEHADELDGAVGSVAIPRGHHGVRVAVAEGECLYVEGVSERRKIVSGLRLLAGTGQKGEPAVARHVEQPDGGAMYVGSFGVAAADRGRDEVRLAVAQGEHVDAADAFEVVVDGLVGGTVGGAVDVVVQPDLRQQRRRRRREERVDSNVLRAAERVRAAGIRQGPRKRVSGKVGDGPAVEQERIRAGVVQGSRAVALPDRVLEDERRGAVARGVRRGAGRCAARVQLECGGSAAGSLVDGDGLVKVERDRHDRVRVGDGMRAVQVVVRGRDGLRVGADVVDGEPLELAQRASRRRIRQYAVGRHV